MHARSTTIRMDPELIDEAVRQLEGEDIPVWQAIEGFKGFTLLVDRQSGKVVGTSFWESAEAMEASEDTVASSRQRTAERGGASEPPAVEHFEVALDTMV